MGSGSSKEKKDNANTKTDNYNTDNNSNLKESDGDIYNNKNNSYNSYDNGNSNEEQDDIFREESININDIVPKNYLEPIENKDHWFTFEQIRGHLNYYPPNNDWRGFGLKVSGKYDKGNDNWIKMDGNNGEWAIGYYQTTVEEAREICSNYIQPFMEKSSQYRNVKNINNFSKHKYKICDIGVICYNNIFKPGLIKNNNIILMCRINPKLLRIPLNCDNVWITDGKRDSIRPYRILIHKYNPPIINHSKEIENDIKSLQDEEDKNDDMLNDLYNINDDNDDTDNYDRNTKPILDKLLDNEKNYEGLVDAGNYIEKKIEMKKKQNPYNYIKIDDALKEDKLKSNIFILGVLGNILKKAGVRSVEIDKADSKNKEYLINNELLFNAFLDKKKYEFNIKSEQSIKNNILKNTSEKNKFINKYKNILSKKLNIKQDDIYITNLRIMKNITFDVIFKTNDFTNTSPYNCLKIKFKELLKNINKTHPEIMNIFETNIISACELTPDMLDSRGNQFQNWAPKNSKRGNLDYFPPGNNWVGYGLKVLGEYKDGDDWIGKDGNPKEWAVAYHGTSEKAVKPITEKQFHSKRSEGAPRQLYEEYENVNKYSKQKYKKCGQGAYSSPKLDIAEGYGKVVIMCRVNPKLVRMPKSNEKEIWITDGTKNTIRPYRILYKMDK